MNRTTQTDDKIKELLIAQGRDPGARLGFGMQDGKPVLSNVGGWNKEEATGEIAELIREYAARTRTDVVA